MTTLEMVMAAAVFVAGGVVKGTLGIGLPLVSVPLLSLFIPATHAIALVAMPVLVSNAWQAFDSGKLQSLRRFAPLIATQLVATLLTVPMTLAMSAKATNVALGVVVLLAVALLCLPLRLEVAPERERWWSAGIGALSGVMGGVSSLTGPLIISYLMSLRLSREIFIGSISLIYLGAAIPLYASMAAYGRLGSAELALSALALVPMALGLAFGRKLREHLSEIWFRRALLTFLSVVAVVLALK